MHVISLFNLQRPKATAHRQNLHYTISIGIGNTSDFGAKTSGNLKILTQTPRLTY